MADQESFIPGQNDDEYSAIDSSSLSIDDLLQSAKDDIQRLDAMMGTPDDFMDGQSEDASDLSEERFDFEEAPSAPKAVEEPEEDASRPAFRLPPVVKVLIYVCCVLSASVLLAIGAWFCADDVLALTKEESTVTVTIPENATIADVSSILHQQGLVRYEWLFKGYCWFSHAESKIQPGTYDLNSVYDYHAIVAGLMPSGGNRATVSVTIPEGYTCKDTFALLADNGVCTVDALEQAAASYEFDYLFLQTLPYGDTNRLEGYLFPDTYEFYVGDDPEAVLNKFLRNFESKLTDEMYTQLDTLNHTLAAKMRDGGFSEDEITKKLLSMHDIVIIASLIEKESAKTSESATIASVIYNRLCSKMYPCLELDATIQYILTERKQVLTNEDKNIISPYNTYTNAGLPAGPIASPSSGSLRAALNPADTDYYFYAYDTDGAHHFSETYYEHQRFLDELNGESDEDETEDGGLTAEEETEEETADGTTDETLQTET